MARDEILNRGRRFGLRRLLASSAAADDVASHAVEPPANVAADGARGGWQVLCAVEIVNFAQLRRHVGTARADGLVMDVASRIAARLPDVRLSAIGRTALELAFDGGGIGDLNSALSSLNSAFATPLDIDGEHYRFDVALSGVGAPFGQVDSVRLAEELEEAAELARTEQRIVVRDLSEAAPAFDRLTLIRDLGTALENGEMFLQYQPKVHVRRQKVTSAEALIRWHHPTRGLVLPGDFIPAAEESREIAALTLWTLDQVVADQERLRAAGHELDIFVNISGRLLGDAAFIAEASERVQAGGGRIGFEITETSVIRDPDTAIAHLRQVADIGIPIAIDDYGAGLSSLAYLKQLPARELKIDKMFVMQLTSSNRDPLIVRSTIDLAHALEMEVTAEGVETQAALALLSVMGCDMVQGFLISRPVSLEALLQFLDDNHYFTGAEVARGSFNQPASFWKRA
jgi:EAL domain-containing protein (putative c-di-GMP-specific phosphodiesterase class I)